MSLFNAARKEEREVESLTEIGREFHEAIVDGKKDCEKCCELQCIFRMWLEFLRV